MTCCRPQAKLRPRQLRRLAWWVAAAVVAPLCVAWAQAYCHITDVIPKELTNGVQVLIKADGVLEWEPEGRDWDEFYSDEKTTRIAIRFTNARSKVGKNFIPVDMTPVSHVQVSIPQDAPGGVGVTVTVVMSEPSFISRRRMNEDQMSYLITIDRERTIEKREEKNEEGSKKEVAEELDVSFEDDLLTVRAVKADIHRVMGEIAQKSGVNLAVDSEVKHKVSMMLTKQPCDVVLRAIAGGYGLALSQVGDVYMFSEGIPTDLASYNRSGTQSFRMRYMEAQTASGLLPTFLFSYLNVNKAQNAVVVTAPSQMLDKIGADLAATDKAPPLILIEALVVEMTSTEDLDLGLSWMRRTPSHAEGADNTTGELRFRDLDRVDADRAQTDLRPTRELAGALRALLESGKAEIKANPRMAAMNGQKAEIFVGAQRFIQVKFLQYGQQQERIQSVPVGVRLEVTPWTGGNGEITVKGMAEVSNISSIDPETGLPLLSTRRAESTVRVRDNETIVIGGLLQRQEQVTRREVPFLGKLPIIGPALFRSKTRSFVNTELVIFVTPRILTETGHLPDAEQEQQIRDRFLADQAKEQ